ncbi:MAG: amidohydrolase [Candidatus Edwardsbacteria bacterium]|nr:amidohydrolase [Candidatus Edwardsbacteria bacterium]
MKRRSADLASYLADWRRHFHRRPELSFHEERTAKTIATELSKLGLSVREGCGGTGGTGVVGLLTGKSPGKTVALRADMDCLPVDELCDVPYRSMIPGRMHACGHDGHMAMLLGAAKLLAAQKDRLKGSVKFLFQPGEETPPGGALGMIKDGALKNPEVDAVFAIHVDSTLPSGTVGLRKGPMMAASDNFRIEITGKGGHAARPHSCLDPVVAGAEIVTALQTIVSRKVDPAKPAVVTVGKFIAGTKHNIIPQTAHLEGTARTIDRHSYNMMPRWIGRIAANIARAHGQTIEYDYERGYPVLENDPAMVDLVAEVVSNLFGKKAVKPLGQPLMGGEDFAYFLQKAPGCLIRLGTNSGPDTAYPWHHPKFNIDEKALLVGARLLAEIAEGYLTGRG